MPDDFQIFKAWISALIDEKIGDAFGQDTFNLSIDTHMLETELVKLINEKRDNGRTAQNDNNQTVR